MFCYSPKWFHGKWTFVVWTMPYFRYGMNFEIRFDKFCPIPIKRSLFAPASGVIGLPWPYTSKYWPKTWRGFIFGPYAHLFSKNLNFFFRFFKNPKGEGPWGLRKNRKNKFIMKKCAYGPKMKPRQVLGKYFEVYGLGNPITPEAGEKSTFF